MSDDPRSVYRNPLASRYASPEMLAIFGERRKFSTWRRLWLALARAQHELGLPISADQLAEMERHLDDIDFAAAEAREREVRHDVMAHVHVFGRQCPTAAPIMHLGATSMFVVDNTDLVLMRDALALIRKRIVRVIAALATKAKEHADTACLSYTHYQPAQPTTFGRRMCLYLQDMLLDLEECEQLHASIRFRGAKGTTGTQASFLTLFGGDHDKVRELDRRVAAAMGFDSSYPVVGQTVTRKIDARVLSHLSRVAQSVRRFSNDVRLLMGMGCVEEPWQPSQIGSSAMAYKRNPMRSERMTSLARVVMSHAGVAAQTAAEQWLERTLDDSAGKRIVVPESFLATDAILLVYENVAGGLRVFPAALMRELRSELPAMATEDILMRAVSLGGDRQELHEVIREHAHAAARAIKEDGAQNDLLDRLCADPAFAAVKDEIPAMVDPQRFLGRSREQVAEFLAGPVAEALERNRDALGDEAAALRV